MPRFNCKFIGEATIEGAVLHGMGHGSYKEHKSGYGGVGLKLSPDKTKIAHGEVFEIPEKQWEWLDSIESNGFTYTREVVSVYLKAPKGLHKTLHAWVYVYTHERFRPNPIEGGVF